MPLNAFQLVDQFKMESMPQRQMRQAQNALQQIQLGEQMRTIENRNALNTIGKQTADPAEMAKLYQQQTGDMQGTWALEDRARQQDTQARDDRVAILNENRSKLQYIAESSKMVTEANYGQWREGLIKDGIAGPGDLPEAYDRNTVRTLQGRATDEIKQIEMLLPGGKKKQVTYQDGKVIADSGPVERWQPRQPPKPTETDRKAAILRDAGFSEREIADRLAPQGGEQRMTETERKAQILRDAGYSEKEIADRLAPPKTGTGANARDIQLSEWLVSEGIAPDADTAWSMVQEGKTNPQATATQLAREAFKSQRDSGVYPESPDYKSVEQWYDHFYSKLSGPGARAPRAGKPTEAPAKDAKPPQNNVLKLESNAKAVAIRDRFYRGEITREQARKELEALNGR